MNRMVYLSAGHSNTPGKDRGAAANGFIEGDLTVELRDMVAKIIINRGYLVITDQNDQIIGDMVRSFKEQLKHDNGNAIVCDIHFNSLFATSTGTEVVVRQKPIGLEMKMAARLSEAISKAIGIKNRGVKTEADSARGKLHLFQQINPKEAITVLPEICFISNPTDMRFYWDAKDKVAQAIADVLIEFIC